MYILLNSGNHGQLASKQADLDFHWFHSASKNMFYLVLESR